MTMRSPVQTGELEFEIGQEINFTVDGAYWSQGTSIVQITPAFYEIIRLTGTGDATAGSGMEWITPAATNANGLDGATAHSAWTMRALLIYEDLGTGSLDQTLYMPDEQDTDGVYTVSAIDFTEGDRGFILVHAGKATVGSEAVLTLPFKISNVQAQVDKTDYIKDTDIADTGAGSATTNPDSLAGRLLTCERNQTEVLMPRLRRALGLLGEHQLVDGFLYDDDGNITECRLRLFESAAALTDNATIWNDRVNDSETDADLVTGEEARYTITASNLLPRNLRTSYQQKITLATTPGGGTADDTPNDEGFGDMSSGDDTNNGSVM